MGGFPRPIIVRLYGGRVSHKGQRYDVRLDNGEMLVTGSLDPSFDAARALLAKGLTGPFEVRDGITGGLRMTFPSVEAATEHRAGTIDASRARAPLRETADDYPFIVAQLPDGRRVIECATDLQWIVQTKQGRQWKSGWYCRTLDALLRGGRSQEYRIAAAMLPADMPDGYVPRAERMKPVAGPGGKAGPMICDRKPFSDHGEASPERLTRLGVAMIHPEAPTLLRAVSQEDEWGRIR
jgi:hypothetical protein